MLKPTADALYKIWRLVSCQLEICESNIETYEFRRRFFSMPDEVLSMVLEYAALQAPRKDDNAHEDKKSIVSTVKAATRLSHVCQRFRDLIVHSSMIWKRVFNGMGSSDMVSTCLSHCKISNAEVTLLTPLFSTEMYSDWYKNTSFISTILKKTENWGSFTLQGDRKPFPNFRDPNYAKPRDYRQLTKKLYLPQSNTPRNSLSTSCRDVYGAKRLELSQHYAFLFLLVNTEAAVHAR